MPDPTIYTVATAHLDTSWHWTLERTIGEYIPKTLEDNFALFEKYPDYTFSFEGAYRYALMEEYYPELFKQLEDYIAQGRWRVAGSAWENGDVNIPSPEALLRNFLLGNNYFEEKFGKRSCDVYLPDCFGFGRALPGVAAHANLKGFTTQKLMWGAGGVIPFGLGRWQGPDGGEIFACPDGQNYNGSLKNVRKNYILYHALRNARRRKVMPAAMRLHGVGDIGGAPREPSVKEACDAVSLNSTKNLKVRSAGSDDIYRDIDALPAAERAAFPVYKGEWLLTDHGTGCYTARALSKRWNRQAEQLAAAAESACGFAGLLGRMDYPKEALNTAWKRVIAHQFHDDITGTSDEISYRRNWDDLMVSQQQFAGLYTDGISAVTGAMDIGFAVGRCAAVSNVTQWDRRESVQARLPQALQGSTVRVYDSEGSEVPAQLLADGATVVFAAAVPPMSVSLYDIQVSAVPCGLRTGLKVTERLLENHDISAEIDENGDIVSLYDKRQRRQMLSGPVRLGLYNFDGSPIWPAWELDYRELKRRAAAYPKKPKIEIIEQGPARAALRITREARGSVFTQVISLDAAGGWLRVQNDVDWQSLRTLLKVEFPMAAENKQAVYDIGFGAVQRGVNTSRLYEVPAQQWAGITDEDGSYGMAVLSDSKTGWDHPNRNTLRLTGVYTPRSGCRGNAHLLDFGRNRFDFALFPYAGNSYEPICRAGACFGQKLAAFWPAADALQSNVRVLEQGRLYGVEESNGPRQLRFGSVGQGMLLRAFKRSEDGSAWVLRVQEANGLPLADGKITLGGGISSFDEIYGSEEPRGAVNYASLHGGALHIALNPFEIRSFKLQAEPISSLASAMEITELALDGEPLPLLPGQCPVLRCKGQTIALPAGKELRLTAASLQSDREVEFQIGDDRHSRMVFSALEPVGAGDLPGLGVGGYVKNACPVREFTHTHGENGEVLIGACARFYEIKLPLYGEETTLTLPDDETIVLLSAAVYSESGAQPACDLYDQMERRPDGEPYALTPKQLKAKSSKTPLRKFTASVRMARGFLRMRMQVDFGRKR